MAVGNGSPGQVPVAYSRNGTGWTAGAVPLPAGGTDGTLYGVSCSTVTSCLAGGYDDSTAGRAPLAELWNGTAFTAETSIVVPPHSQLSDFSAVSCPTEFGCTAAGFYVTSHRGAERLLAEQES